jgi:class 3 adenylate cyclase
VFEKYEAIEVFTEADNFWVIFPSAQHATLAALEAQHVLTVYNSLQKHLDFQIRLSGFGIDVGRNVYVNRHTGKLFGTTVDRAFHLGEDLAENCTILVTDQVKQRLLHANKEPYFSLFHRLNPSPPNLSLSPLITTSSTVATTRGYIDFTLFTEDTATATTTATTTATASSSSSASEPNPAPPQINDPIWILKGRLPHPPTLLTQLPRPPLGINQLLTPNPEANEGVKLFLQRHLIMLSLEDDLTTKMTQLQQLDMQIRSQYMKQVTAMMYGCDWISTLRASSVEHILYLHHFTYTLLTPIVREFNGQIVEENLFFFSSPLDALRAMLKMNRTIRYHNKTIKHPTNMIPLKGIALHSGEVVIIPNTNVHWGIKITVLPSSLLSSSPHLLISPLLISSLLLSSSPHSLNSSSPLHSFSGDPVNTASKLAEDLATGGVLLITTNVQQVVVGSMEYSALHAEPLTLETTKDKFQCYKLLDPTQDYDNTSVK